MPLPAIYSAEPNRPGEGGARGGIYSGMRALYSILCGRTGSPLGRLIGSDAQAPPSASVEVAAAHQILEGDMK
jgi:hypothetical protein